MSLLQAVLEMVDDMQASKLSEQTMRELERRWAQEDLLAEQGPLQGDAHPFSADHITVFRPGQPPKKVR